MKHGSMLKLLLSVLCGVVLFGSTVHAEGGYLENPFGDTGARTSIGGDAKYYDFLFPYDLTYREIGGYAVSYCTTGSYHPMLISDQKSGNNFLLPSLDDKLNFRFNVQWTLSQLKKVKSKGSYKFPNGCWFGNEIKEDENCGLLYVECLGRKSYMMSLPKAVFNNSVYANSESGFDEQLPFVDNGVLFDIILKDGTVICCVAIDGMGYGHTNNISSDNGTSQDNITFSYSQMYPDETENPYRNLYYAASPNHSFEVCSNSSDYDKIYNYLGISDNNPIVAVRVWNKTLKNNDFEALQTRLVVHSLNDDVELNLEGGSNEDSSEQYVEGYYKETSMVF